MKHCLLFSVIILFPCFLFAQKDWFVDSILKNNIILLSTYHQSKIGNESIFFKMNFGQPEILDTTGIYQLKNAEIFSVDLVFTDYPSNNSLKELNAKRIKNLQKLLPFITSKKNIDWQIVRQMDGKDKATAETLLHGFIINYRRAYTKEAHEKEIKFINEYSKLLPQPEESLKKVETPLPPKKIRYWDVIYGDAGTAPVRYIGNRPVKEVSEKRIPVDEGEIIVGLHKSDPYCKKYLTPIEKKRFIRIDTIYFVLLPPEKKETKKAEEIIPAIISKPRLSDSTIEKSLGRNSYKKVLLIMDVTMSMAPFSAATLSWLSDSANQLNIKYVTCFNDGNDMRDELKKTGITGGIYGEVYKNPLRISKLIETTMDKGSGGDTPENVCEAIINSIEQCGDCNDVVLIADNWAGARDIELVNKISKPVNIIICGGTTGVHPDYVTIASTTNGSLHFDNEDVKDLPLLKQGKTIIIRGIAFKLNEQGRAIAVRR
jgi:hypothetical protein